MHKDYKVLHLVYIWAKYLIFFQFLYLQKISNSCIHTIAYNLLLDPNKLLKFLLDLILKINAGSTYLGFLHIEERFTD